MKKNQLKIILIKSFIQQCKTMNIRFIGISIRNTLRLSLSLSFFPTHQLFLMKTFFEYNPVLRDQQ